MTSILALEASTPACSVALWQDGLISEKFDLAPRSHTQNLLPMVQSLLSEAGLQLVDLDAIAFARGPGSFTGLRIACGVAQGLAYGADLPVVPVSTLESMAFAYLGVEPVPEGTRFLVSLDARMEEVYLGQWQLTGTGLQPLGEEQLRRPDDFRIEAGAWVCLGDGIPLLDFRGEGVVIRVQQPDFLPRASAVVALAAQALAQGKVVTASGAEPVYLRGRQAWKTVSQQKA